MMKNIKKVNPLALKKQLDVKNLKDNINNMMKLKVNFKQKRMEAEEKANVYGFNRELIGTPRSL